MVEINDEVAAKNAIKGNITRTWGRLGQEALLSRIQENVEDEAARRELSEVVGLGFQIVRNYLTLGGALESRGERSILDRSQVTLNRTLDAELVQRGIVVVTEKRLREGEIFSLSSHEMGETARMWTLINAGQIDNLWWTFNRHGSAFFGHDLQSDFRVVNNFRTSLARQVSNLYTGRKIENLVTGIAVVNNALGEFCTYRPFKT